MRLGAADLAVLALYAAAVAWLGFNAARRRRPGAEDYILAGRRLTLPSFVATLVPAFFGGTLGVGEYAYRFGVSNWVTQGLPYYVFALLYALWLAPRVRAAPGMTIPDHLEGAYGRGMAVAGAALVFLLASPADEALMLGILLGWATGWPAALCAAGAVALAFSFMFRGGLRSDVWASRLEIAVMYGGFALILPGAWSAARGLEGLRAALPAEHLNLTGGQPLPYLLTWFFIALWTFVDPAFHQRVCAARDVRTARLGICVSVAFWAAFDLMTTSAGLCARALSPDLADPLRAYPALAERLLPPAVRGLFLAGVASSTLAALTTTGFLAAVSLGRDACGRLWRGREDRQEAWVRAGLAASGVWAVSVAWALPSVVDIWYTVGSCVIPGLLVPLISAYFAPLRVPPAFALGASLAGFGAALAAWTLGLPFPFYAGLGASLAAWGAGKVARIRT